MANTKWKDFLLKSGLPLEYEVKEYLNFKGCVSISEYSYLRPDENEVINEFSFDIDSSYIKNEHFFQLLVECKYRDSSTNWLFLPTEYNGLTDLSNMAFLHPNDHFTEKTKFKFNYPQLPPISKACAKGIEITSEGPNPKTITQAVSQLSYAMAGIVVDNFEHQIKEYLTTREVIFYNIPIIITTANIFRLKENVTIEAIKQTEDLTEIATKEDCVVIETKAGKDLERYNRSIFNGFKSRYKDGELDGFLNSFNTDSNFVLDVIASNYCPQAMLVIQHTPDNTGLNRLFELLDDIVNPSEKTIKYIEEEKEKNKRMMQEFERTFGPMRPK